MIQVVKIKCLTGPKKKTKERERERRKLEQNPRKKGGREREVSSKCYQSLTDQ